MNSVLGRNAPSGTGLIRASDAVSKQTIAADALESLHNACRAVRERPLSSRHPYESVLAMGPSWKGNAPACALLFVSSLGKRGYQSRGNESGRGAVKEAVPIPIRYRSTGDQPHPRAEYRTLDRRTRDSKKELWTLT